MPLKGPRKPVKFPEDHPTWPCVKEVLEEMTTPCKTTDSAFKLLCKLHAAKCAVIAKAGKPPKPKSVSIEETPFQGLASFYKCHAVNNEVELFLSAILPNLARLALDVAHLKPAGGELFISEKGVPESVSLERKFVAGIVATGFLCLFPSYKPSKQKSTLCGFSFERFFPHLQICYQQQKLRCILNYFHRLAADDNNLPGKITFRRIVLTKSDITKEKLVTSSQSLCDLDALYEGKIEDAHTALQVDFANEYIGGGVLGRGSLQEEIRFCICPELLAAMLFMERMACNEAIVIQGCEQFSNYTGYRETMMFAGNSVHSYPPGADGSVVTALTAIDAVPYPSHQSKLQYRSENIMRELTKAYAGFSQPYAKEGRNVMNEGTTGKFPLMHESTQMSKMVDPAELLPIATGNWGCGAFGGDVQLKALLQWLAASYANCPCVLYYTFNDPRIRGLAEMASLIRQECGTVGSLMSLLFKVCKEAEKGHSRRWPGIFDTIWQQLSLSGRNAAVHIPEAAGGRNDSGRDRSEKFGGSGQLCGESHNQRLHDTGYNARAWSQYHHGNHGGDPVSPVSGDYSRLQPSSVVSTRIVGE